MIMWQMMEMASSHALLAGMAAPTSSAGIGFGLGGWVAQDAVAGGGLLGPSPGTYSWGGAAATTCVIDRAADVGYLFYTQQLMCAQRELSNMGRGGLITMVYASIMEPSPSAGGATAPGGGAVVSGPSAYPRL